MLFRQQAIVGALLLTCSTIFGARCGRGHSENTTLDSVLAVELSNDSISTSKVDLPEAQLLAARYHLRGRSTRFFRRSAVRSYRPGANYRYRHSGSFGLDTTHDEQSIQTPVRIAARYHLRYRTNRFFRRALV